MSKEARVIEKLGSKDFAGLLRQIFEVFPRGMSRVEVELVEVEENKMGGNESFSLLFRGPAEKVFNHDTHKVKHPALGELEVFLGPVFTGKTDGVYYQAVFNRSNQ